jgi:hypothetical protein
MSLVVAPTGWSGYYAVRVQIDVGEYALDGQITRQDSPPRLFSSREEAKEHAKRWNTGEVIQYNGKV